MFTGTKNTSPKCERVHLNQDAFARASGWYESAQSDRTVSLARRPVVLVEFHDQERNAGDQRSG